MNKQDIIATLSPIAATIGTVFGALKTPRGKRMLLSILGSDNSLETKINAAIHASVSALQAALDARGEELARLEQELAALNTEVARLKTADDWKTARIEELEAEIVSLREENQALRAELAKRRGGRPKKVVEEG